MKHLSVHRSILAHAYNVVQLAIGKGDIGMKKSLFIMLGVIILPSHGLLSVILNYVVSKRLKVNLKRNIKPKLVYVCTHI